MKVFVSLPITGHIERARMEAARVKEVLKRQGHEAVPPFEVAPDPGRHESYYMGRCVEALMQCDFICQYPEWWESKGCTVEDCVARTYVIPYFDWPSGILF